MTARTASSCASRGDHLISAHLALGMAADTVVLQMIRRDREQGTAIHRAGKREHVPVLARLAPAESDAAGILGMLLSYGALFDELAPSVLADYAPRFSRFRAWARAMLA